MFRSVAGVDSSPMDSGSAGRSGRVPVCYRIVVRGEVTERFAKPLKGVVVESAGDQSILQPAAQPRHPRGGGEPDQPPRQRGLRL